MKRILLLCLTAVFALASSELWAQERTVSGRVTSAEDGTGLPGVNVVLKGTTNGAVTDAEGNYSLSVPQEGGTLVFTFIGLKSEEVEIGSRTTVDVPMTQDVTQLGEVVVTALGVAREVRTLPYAAQQVTAKDLNITQNTDFKGALAGKVAGVQVNGQAGSKLGEFGKIRIRGAISLTSDQDPLYVVDGVPITDPNDVDMNNVESINILKGPNATSLYGQRAQYGVVMISTKKGGKGVSVEIQNSTTWDKVSYLPNYQNLYGGGYEGADSFGTFDYDNPIANPYPSEWQVFDGKRYLLLDNNYADESWGPKFDGQDYVPWYAWWPDSPYYGQTAKYTAQPDNIRNFYQTGFTEKNTVALSGGGDNYTGRIAYTELYQKGITPFTDYKKHYVLANISFNPVSKLKVSSSIRFTNSRVHGYFDDGYGNQTSGSFNSWFNRQIEVDKLRELKDLKTINGASASWNWWGPDYYTLGDGYEKPAFWFNHYTLLDQYSRTGKNNNLSGNLSIEYQIMDGLSVGVTGSENYTEYRFDWKVPFSIANSSAPDLYNPWSNSFGTYRRSTIENNYTATVKYDKRFGDIDVSAMVGGNIRTNSYGSFQAQMDPGAKTGGLIIPDVYSFSNAGIVPVPSVYNYRKQVNSIYGDVSVGYKDMIYIDGSYRKDYSSALPTNQNGYGYPSVGASFVFSELLNSNVLSFGKIRGGWAQVGSDVDALLINPIYTTGTQPFNGDKVLMYNPTQLVDPNIKPALNSSMETGFDLRFLESRIGLNFTYYVEHRDDEIIPVSIPRGSGYDTYLTNAGKASRKGIEIILDADVLKTSSGFNWNIALNYSKNKTTVDELPGDLKAIKGVGGFGASSTGVTGQTLVESGDFGFISVINELDENWGQLRGTKIARDAKGNAILQPNGLYETELDQYFGSILPDFIGGVVNRFSYQGFTLTASIDFQKGGKFFSLSEMWGENSGLLEETAGINDKGKNVRDDPAEGGGVHVTGVDETGAAVDMYVDAHSYYAQWYSNLLAEPFIHDASYIKLRDVSLSYDFSRFIKSKFIKGATFGLVGRDLALLAVSKDNKNKWDPSVMSTNYGENAQLPGTRSYGMNISLRF